MKEIINGIINPTLYENSKYKIISFFELKSLQIA